MYIIRISLLIMISTLCINNKIFFYKLSISLGTILPFLSVLKNKRIKILTNE